ncbi:thiamine diphosphokinase [Paenirhodobacter populi]|uniref:thiamine diphosphokinase n=1 Tax=Paenirhodobacter populi TaxID=2306993 RepID=UPI000FE41F1E|nr:thiamine diphosphokinase [Sinirhodobacter populi]RWR05123.1 thiamine diphosphokinase [Sinirhodobacter populi]
MSDVIRSYAQGVTLLGGGTADRADLAMALGLAPGLVAADGGGDRALALGLVPDAVIGDLDSLSAAGRTRLGARVHHVAEQDSTDFGKCLNLVRARFYLGLGFTGLRLDHTLAALSEIAQRPGQPVILIAEDDAIFRAPRHLRLDLPAGERFSIFPFGAVTGRSEGLNWPIEGLDFAPAGRVGTSNRVTGPVTLELEGPALILVPKRYLGRLPAALGLL